MLDNDILGSMEYDEMRLYSSVKNKLNQLNSSVELLLKDGLFNLYMELNELRHSAQRDNFTQMTQ